MTNFPCLGISIHPVPLDPDPISSHQDWGFGDVFGVRTKNGVLEYLDFI